MEQKEVHKNVYRELDKEYKGIFRMDKNKLFELIKNYLNYLKENKFSIYEAYLFGSYAKGDYREESDIDLAIILDKCVDNYEDQIKMMKMRRNFDLRIEPHPFEKSDVEDHNPFLEEILRTGIRV